MIKFFYSIIFIIRYILNLPLIIIAFTGTAYAKLLKIIDPKNHNSFWQELLQLNIEKFISKKIIISNSPEKSLLFYIPSKIAGYRVKTFFTKEPETLAWLNQNGSEKKILFDIGANMGIYSLYYAKKFNSKVISFEPSIKNLEFLTKNIKVNNLENNITVISNPLTKTLKVSDFYQSNFVGGGANASLLSKAEKHKSKQYYNNRNEIFYKTLGISLDKFFDFNPSVNPSLIKIDVDGNELDIIKGAKKLLSRNLKISLLIEIREETEQEVNEILRELDFKMIKKYENNNNVIWEK